MIIDASAVAEVLVRSPVGSRVVELVQGRNVVAPELLDAEVLSYVRKKTLQGILTVARAREMLEDFRAWPIERLSHRNLLETAFEFRNNLTAYDALYVAAALATNLGIVTADRRMVRARVAGVQIHDVSE